MLVIIDIVDRDEDLFPMKLPPKIDVPSIFLFADFPFLKDLLADLPMVEPCLPLILNEDR
jgi:hypothetical protein